MKIEIEIKIPEVVGSNPHETLAILDFCFDFFFCPIPTIKPFHRPSKNRFNF
jgi:hypothetical protein